VLLVVTGAMVSAAEAQTIAETGLVVAVNAEKNALTLETRGGSKQVPVAAAATIRGDHGEVLALGDLKPGDAVAYTRGSDTATSLRVARHFWAVPTEP
jgi:hypothetical protein